MSGQGISESSWIWRSKAARLDPVTWNVLSTILKPLELGLMPLDRFLVLSALVGVAGVERVAHPFQHLVVELEPPEQFGELRFERFLTDIFASAGSGVALALIGVAGAVIVDVAFLLDLADHRAAADMAGDQPGDRLALPSFIGGESGQTAKPVSIKQA